MTIATRLVITINLNIGKSKKLSIKIENVNKVKLNNKPANKQIIFELFFLKKLICVKSEKPEGDKKYNIIPISGTFAPRLIANIISEF